ncbi:MAG TPA: hypothetical protein VMP67_04025 [Candidatus Limnocylindria bacterium]|nr:hypothetical protein [Candidatus Limnocylindria bacterium]
MSRFWPRALRAQYALLALLDPLIRRLWRRFGVGNVIEVRIARRDGAGQRSRLLGILHAGGGEYLGHPNGHVGWTRDLLAAGRATLVWPAGGELREVQATLLAPGPEREAAILATNQHPFPGNLVYLLARGHIRAVGVYFRLEG